MAARFQRRAAAADDRVGEILSDSNSDVSSLDEEDGGGRRGGAARAAPSTAAPKRRGGPDPEVVSASDDSQRDDDNDDGDAKDAKAAPSAVAARVHQRPAPVQAIKRKNSKWYDSEDDDDWDHMASDGDRGGARAARSRSVPEARRDTAPPPPPPVNTAVEAPSEAAPRGVLSPEASTAATKPPPEKRSSFQRLVGKTFNLSPFGSKRKQALENVTSPASSGPDTPRASERADSQSERTSSKQAETAARMRSPMSDVSSVGDTGGNPTSARFSNASEQRRLARKKSQDPGSDVVSPQGYRGGSAAATTNNDGSATSRRRSNMVQSPVGDDALVSPAMRRGSELAGGTTGGGASEALSPGQRKVPGAFPGRPDSGVLLEGWLRQKQRRGVKGMKKWNSRYFVLYAKTNEVRYYADVVQSAWGPIPLGEIGCISLRLIQRIGKPGTLKYKGCRLDITCRNTWGTHYADDYVSSDDENNNSNNAARSADKNTPKSSRVYSLMADSPQTAGAWFSTLDSLLVRSANSPRVDVAPSSATGKQQLKRMGSTAVAQNGGANTPSAGKTVARRRTTSTLDAESLVLCGPNDHVPRPVLYAINFIFDSSPGIETEKFYETEPDAARLKAALKFLNQFALDNTRKPSREELEQALDPVTAGAVVKLWLAQLEQPIVPFEMFDDFRAVATEAKSAPFELARNLKALVGALPPRHFAMLACVLFHLNDVSAYASKNAMDAALLSGMFGDFIVRPRGASATTTPSNNNNNADADLDSDRQLLRVVVEEMITHVDAIIDEKEAESLERV